MKVRVRFVLFCSNSGHPTQVAKYEPQILVPTPPTYHCFRNIHPWVCVKIFSCILIIPTIVSSLGVVRPNFLVHTFTHSTWPSVRLKAWVIGKGDCISGFLGHRFLWEGPCKFTILSWSLDFSEEVLILSSLASELHSLLKLLESLQSCA